MTLGGDPSRWSQEDLGEGKRGIWEKGDLGKRRGIRERGRGRSERGEEEDHGEGRSQLFE